MAITTLLRIVTETIENLQRLPQRLRDRLIALKQELPHTPLEKLPDPVRLEVKQILASLPARTASATADNKPMTNRRSVSPATSNRLAVPHGPAPNGQANVTRPQPHPPDESSSLTVLGTDSKTGEAVTLSLKERLLGLYVIGATGT